MDIESEYQKTLDYLYSFVDYSLTHAFRYSPDKFELGRMYDFMGYLGSPQHSYPIIHIAGTKGKGSVSAFCASALQAAGYRVGLYTSPHLQDYSERIQVNGKPISHQDIIELTNRVRPYLEPGTRLTTFEITTALALLYFYLQRVDVAVVEVGLGGRLDATNVVDPIVAGITSLSLDHTGILGDTLAAIAAEKGGIIKPGIPVVSAPQAEEAQQVLAKLAKEKKAPFILVGRDYLFREETHSLDGQELYVWKNNDVRVRLHIPLLGTHQVLNAAVAFAILQIVRNQGVKVQEEDIRKGFSAVEWPGRFEILQKDPPLVIDCAHNPESARMLRKTVDDYFPEKKIILVFGVSEDKDIRGIIKELMWRTRLVILTRSTHPRAMDPEKMVEFTSGYASPVQVVDKVEDAMEIALDQAGGEDLVLVTGSIFVAAGVRYSWFNRHSGD